jgi:hypothetical protein
MKNWADGWLNTFSGLDNTPMNGNSAEMLMASIKEATVINPNKRIKYTFLLGVRFLQTLLKLFFMDGLGISKYENLKGCFNRRKWVSCSVLTRFRPDESQMPLQSSALLSSKNTCFYVSAFTNIV